MKTTQAILGLLASASLASASAAQAFERDFGYALNKRSADGFQHHRRHHFGGHDGRLKKRGSGKCKSHSSSSGSSPSASGGSSSSSSSGGSGSSSGSSGSGYDNSSGGNGGDDSGYDSPSPSGSGAAQSGAQSSAAPAPSGSAGSGSGDGSWGSGNSGSGGGNSTGSIGSDQPYPEGALFVNNVAIGMVPDGGTDGGSKDTMATLNSLVQNTGGKHATFGQYAQAQSGTDFDGSQLLQVMDDLKQSGAIFEPAVMPTGGWQGLTQDDNSQAVNICNVMKQFTDQGIETRLRFAHEVNWYLTDGTYSGTVDDFKTGWSVVAAACRDIAPDVKMFFTPNVANIDQYRQYFPDDPSTVDLVGIDFYPKQGSDLSSAFLDAMKEFHDEYASETTLFAIGETGLGYAGSPDEKTQWAKAVSDAKTNGMQYLTSSSWFNYQKGYDFKICDPDNDQTTQAYISYLNAS